MRNCAATLLLLFAAAACGAHPKTTAKTTAPPPGDKASGENAAGSIVGPGIGHNLAKCGGVLAKDALCKCLSDAEVEVDTCDLVDDGKLPGHVLRVGNDEQSDTFLVVDDGAGLRAIAELLYEQHHGKRDSDLTDPHLELHTIRGARVLRLEYTVKASTDYANDSYDEDVSGTAVLVCVLDGAGAPSCPITTYKDCTVDRTDYASPPNPANNGKGSTTAHVDIADDGTATVTKDSETGTPLDCAIKPQTVHLVP